MKYLRIIWRGFLTIKRCLRNEIINYYYTAKHELNNYFEEHALKNISKPYVLTDEEKEKINNIYQKYGYSNTLLHEFYTQKTHVFSPLYMPDDFYFKYVDPYFSNHELARKFDNKCFYKRMFPIIKQPETIAYRCNGIWFDNNDSIISTIRLSEILHIYNNEVFVKLATDSMGGSGVKYYNNSNIEYSEIIDFIDSNSLKDIVIQKRLIQHSALNKLNESSVNTVRVLSLLNSEEVKIISSILRMGRNGSKVDNASSGGITIGILSDGRLKDSAFSTDGEVFKKIHPTSKAEFSSVTIPNYLNILSKIKELHCLVPYFRLVSWDIAIDESEEPVLIEANLYYGEIDFHQLNNGPLFADDTVKVLEEVFKK